MNTSLVCSQGIVCVNAAPCVLFNDQTASTSQLPVLPNMFHFFTETHDVPVFEGRQSRTHRSVPLWKLGAQGLASAIRHPMRFSAVDVFVQFVGFPRSGHSLIGSILDAHRRAAISHELDAMGLIKKGFPEHVIYALIARNTSVFSRNGRYWNSFSYEVPGQHNGRVQKPTCIGDKKGDWTVRWFRAEPRLIDITRRRITAPCKWILVTRHPLDNIATMSLRKGRTYDKLRIAAENSDVFRSKLVAYQEKGAITSAALDGMIDDYETLCETIERMQAEIPPAEWTHVKYERFVKHPVKEITRICRFLDLEVKEDFLSACKDIVRSSPNNSRNALTWTDRQIDRVSRFTHRFSFLQTYSDTDGISV